MKIGARWFQITGIFVVLELLLGGLVSSSIIETSYHIVLGFVVLAMALATMIVALISKPSPGSLKAISGLLLLLMVLQVPLGYAMLGNNSSLLPPVHAINAIAIAVVAFAGFFVARSWEKKMIKRGVGEVETGTNRET